MQRQSLGSPGSKLNGHGVVATVKEEKLTLLSLEDPKRNNGGGSSSLIDPDEEKDKISKPHKLSSSSSKPEKFIHLIPILTLICFLILYLCSHDPSQSDLAHFDGFKRPSKSVVEDSELNRFLEINRGDVLAIRSLKNLQKSRFHRKIGEF